MPKFVHVQLSGIEKPAVVKADSVETTGMVGSNNFKLSVKLKDQEVGEFNGNIVLGWWFHETD